MSGSDAAALARPRLDTTWLMEDGEDKQQPRCPLFALVSLNAKTAPSAEVPFSQLLALSVSADAEPSVLTVGRHTDCDVQLADPRVSMHHFEIVARRWSDDEDDQNEENAESLVYDCVLNDLSSNGTVVNGKTVGKGNSEKLRSGDEICVLPAHRVGQDKKIAFVFRNTTEVLTTSKEVKSLDLDELVLCPICVQIIHKCVALMPCAHNFCMSCYSDWMRRKDDCPVCRRTAAAIMRNHPMDAVIEAFLEAFPNKRRTPEELRELDANDKLRLSAGGKIVRGTCSVGTSTTTQAAASPPPSTTRSGRTGSQACAVQ